MRKIGFIKSKEHIKEIMPKSYGIEKSAAKRRLFFEMINEFIDPAMRINLRQNRIFEKNLFDIFADKIFSHFQLHALKPEPTQPITRIYTTESLLFQQFFKQCTYPKARYLAHNWEFQHHFTMQLHYTHPAAQLIKMIFDGKQSEIMLDLDHLFAQTVYRRIKTEPGKTVHLDMPYIHIHENGIRTRLYPQWKDVNPNSLERNATQINNGLCQLRDEAIDQIYLIYPKTDRFKQHITIQSTKGSCLKMVPYSFTYTNRRVKTCKSCQKNQKAS